MLTGSARSSKFGDGASMISIIAPPRPKKAPPSRGGPGPHLARAPVRGCADIEAAAVGIGHEALALPGHGLACAEHQQPAFAPRFGEPVEGGAPSLRREIEQDVAAQDDVEMAGQRRRVEDRMDVK